MAFLYVENASGAEHNRVGQILWLLQKALPPNMYSFARTKEYQKGRRCPQGMKAPVGLLSRRPVCKANAACLARQGLCYFRGAGGGGLRLPASASCLARHSHPAGRCPNSSSLHSLFCRYVTSSPGRGKSLAAGRSRRRCVSSAEELFIIEQCRAVCGPPGIAFSRERS